MLQLKKAIFDFHNLISYNYQMPIGLDVFSIFLGQTHLLHKSLGPVVY